MARSRTAMVVVLCCGTGEDSTITSYLDVDNPSLFWGRVAYFLRVRL